MFTEEDRESTLYHLQQAAKGCQSLRDQFLAEYKDHRERTGHPELRPRIIGSLFRDPDDFRCTFCELWYRNISELQSFIESVGPEGSLGSEFMFNSFLLGVEHSEIGKRIAEEERQENLKREQRRSLRHEGSPSVPYAARRRAKTSSSSA